MVLRIFEIEFNSPTKTFIAGQTICGHVVTEVDQIEAKVQELVLRLWGKAEVNWIDSKNGKRDSHQGSKTESNTPEIRISRTKDHRASSDKVFSSEESYFDRRCTVLERKGSEDLLIPIGNSRFPFEIILPTGIPSSFEGEHGSVKYFLEATLKRPSDQHDYTCKSQVYVRGVLDLNSDPQAQLDKPEVTQEEYLGYLCCKNGPIGFSFGVLGSAGVVPGQTVQFLADVFNMSEAREVVIKLKLFQITTYHAQNEYRAVRQELLKLQGPSVRRGGTGTWSGESIQIPESIPPTRLAGRCSIISVEYFLEITLETNKGTKIASQLPIIVGTIPLGAKVEDYISIATSSQPMTNF